jgi:predicted RNA-binding protein Jag
VLINKHTLHTTQLNSTNLKFVGLEHKVTNNSNRNMSVSLAFPAQMPPQPIKVVDPVTGLSVEEISRPFVPSMAPEDLVMAEMIGVLTPRSVDMKLDAKAATFVPTKKSWANVAGLSWQRCETPFVQTNKCWAKLHLNNTEAEEHEVKHQQLLDDIAFLQMVDNQENEEILDEATEWLDEQIHFMNDQYQIHFQENVVPNMTSEVVFVTKVTPNFSFAALDGASCVFLPWGSDIVNIGELLYVDLVFHRQGKNLWKATKIHPKLPAELISEVDVEIAAVHDHGRQYTFNVALKKEDIKYVIGKSGNNINRLINESAVAQKWAWTCDPGSGTPGPPLPEVTITPIDNTNDENIYTFTQSLCQIIVYCPVACPWTKEDVDKLVSQLHC